MKRFYDDINTDNIDHLFIWS